MWKPQIANSDDFIEYEAINLDSIPTSDICVECFTYNQVDYIRDAIESILMQKTDVSYFALIVDDASTDGTTDIIREYALRFPEKIKVLIASRNIFGKKFAGSVYKTIKEEFAVNAKYIATCEGDDYWTDDQKLQIQFSYMEQHSDCMMYLHNSWWYNCQTDQKNVADPFECNREKDLEMGEMIAIRKGHPATASRLYRKELIYAPDFVRNCSVGDYNYMLYAAMKGKVHYSDRIMCTYRYMSKESTSRMITNTDDCYYSFYHSMGILVFLLNFDDVTDYEYHDYISYIIRDYFNHINKLIKKETDFINMWNLVSQRFYLELNTNILYNLSDKFKQENDDSFLPQEIVRYIKGHEHVVIFGMGKYAKKTIIKFETFGLEFDGYVISGDVTENKKNDKPVWSIEKIPFEKDKTCLVVAIMPKENDGVREAVKKSGFTNVIYPYDLYLREMGELM